MAKKVVIYDDNCSKCEGWVNILSRHDVHSRFFVIGQNSIEAKPYFSSQPDSMKYFDSIFLINDKTWHAKSGAMLRIAGGLRFPLNLLFLFLLVPYPIRDFFYDLYARNR